LGSVIDKDVSIRQRQTRAFLFDQASGGQGEQASVEKQKEKQKYMPHS